LAGPRAEANLWPQPQPQPQPQSRHGIQPASSKDSVENKLKQAVCARTISLAATGATIAIAIAIDWTTALARLGLS